MMRDDELSIVMKPDKQYLIFKIYMDFYCFLFFVFFLESGSKPGNKTYFSNDG